MGNGQSSSKQLHLEDFDQVRLIGKGAFGKVWLVRRKEGGELYAMKTLDKQSVVEQNLTEHTIFERDVMLMCNNPFIINLYWSFQTEDKLYFILDFIGGGSLWTHLCNHPKGHFLHESVRFYAAEILLGVEELHNNGIVYRDLKPENMLIGCDGHIVLTDFGLSHNLRNSDGKVHSFSGTAIYIAPEVLLEQGHDHCVDWWSYGVVLYLLLTGEPPFWSDNRKELFDMIREGEINIDHKLLRPDAKDLISKLLIRDTKQRLGAGGAAEIKEHSFFAGMNWNRVIKKKLKPPFIPDTEFIMKSAEPINESERVEGAPVPRTAVEQFKDFSFTKDKTPTKPEKEDYLKRALAISEERALSKSFSKKRTGTKLFSKSVSHEEDELLRAIREQASRDNRNRTFISIKPKTEGGAPEQLSPREAFLPQRSATSPRDRRFSDATDLFGDLTPLEVEAIQSMSHHGVFPSPPLIRRVSEENITRGSSGLSQSARDHPGGATTRVKLLKKRKKGHTRSRSWDPVAVPSLIMPSTGAASEMHPDPSLSPLTSPKRKKNILKKIL